MATPREHIEKIRKTKFSIGQELNPLTEDLHQAVKNLSAELYAKDVHFLMELIQNAEDNGYEEEVKPSLEIIITSQDITATGAPATLLIFNNEKGFSPKNIDSICSVGRSTKKGNRKRGYIGEKGIGFKSVFLITSRPYIFSNGYQIRFNEEPCPHCKLGYIVPEWVEENPTLVDIKRIYGSHAALPTTTIVLPLKPDKVKPVKQQLSSIQPEVLLFLSKIKQFSVKEDNMDPRLNSVSAISISSEINFAARKNMNADSYTLHLSTDASSDTAEKECSYYMWRQKFPVRPENQVESRLEVEEWVITLAFPLGQRLHRGMSAPGIYAFLPTEMVTSFHFIIQADFVLASSRETILLDNKWNQGILDCVPSAFHNAFVSLVTKEDAPVSTLNSLFKFLPINSSSYPKLNVVRELIKQKVVTESIVPCESSSDQKVLRRPCQVGRLMPYFWNILEKAKKQGVSLHSLSSHGKYILNSSFDLNEYDPILNFLGVEPVNNEWYAKCIMSSNLVLGVTEEVYLELLLFIADEWTSFYSTNMKSVPLLKYVGMDGRVALCSINNIKIGNGESMICISRDPGPISWLIDWNREFGFVTGRYFMPKSTQEALSCKRATLLEWLKNQVKVDVVTVYDFAVTLFKSIKVDRKHSIAYAHFLYHSLLERHLTKETVGHLCSIMPLVDNYGNVSTKRKGVLVPASGSKWVQLIGANPWREEGFVELGEDYTFPGSFAGMPTPRGQLMTFLKTHVSASDIPDLTPPNAGLSAAFTPLTKKNAFLLLDWIHHLRYRRNLPHNFLESIKKGNWLKISISGSPGYQPPSQSFLLASSCGDLLHHESVMIDIPLIDEEFYGTAINDYREELKTIGVMFDSSEVCKFIGKRLMFLAASSVLTKSSVLSILKLIKFLRLKFLPADEFIKSIKDGDWLKTSCGYKPPVESVLFDQEWRAARQISDIPFIDQDYYGNEILLFKTELQLLGVAVGFNGNYKLVTKHLKSQACSNYPTAEAILLILECIRQCKFNSISYYYLVQALRSANCLKTNKGYKPPGESFLFIAEWGSLLKVFPDNFPLIDEDFYGTTILSYKNELKLAGVVVDFEEATKIVSRVFKKHASSSTIRSENILSFLASYRQINKTNNKFSADFRHCIIQANWLRTRLGSFARPSECILYSPEWEPVRLITMLPFIDDSDKYYGNDIHAYSKELGSLGVTINYKNGAKFVADNLRFPLDPSVIAAESVLSLLQCVKSLLKDKCSIPELFMKRVSGSWLKTYAGYRSPGKSLLFGSEWSSFLQPTDGPFIDEEFYGPSIAAYKNELGAIGVIVDVSNGHALLASFLDFHSEFSAILRIYHYLNKFSWLPPIDASMRIWIPNGNDSGEFVSPEECVLHDRDSLFDSQMNVLEKHYDRALLSFFSRAIKVKPHPSFDDYCKLWKVWESSKPQLTRSECCAFWCYVTQHWNPKKQKILAGSLSKVPVESSSDEIRLFDKRDVFIADDLQLKYVLESSLPHSIFVWYPQPSIPSLPRTKLLDIYHQIGVRSISESVTREALSAQANEPKQVSQNESLIRKGLLRLILGFLADPSVIEMEAEKRQEAVKGLLNLTIFETLEPNEVSYRLSLSSGETLNGSTGRMIQWDWENKKLFMQKVEMSGGHKTTIEYATHFSEVISEGVLKEKEDLICKLAELIKLAFLLDFDEEAIGFLMRSKNLQVYMEDEEFLSSAFSLD